MYSTVLILPMSLRDAGNAVAMQMGWGPDNYSVELTQVGKNDPTHVGLHAWASDQFKNWVTGAEPLPEGMGAAQVVIDNLIFSFRNENNNNHFYDVIADNQLFVVEYDL